MNKFLWIPILVCFVSCVSVPVNHQNNGRTKSKISISKSHFHPVGFKSRVYGDKDWQAALAMNVAYEPVLELRKKIENQLYGKNKLKYLTSWEAAGEAHITTITPVEYQNCMWSHKRKIKILHISEIEKIAIKHQIQKLDLKFHGVGSAGKNFNSKKNLDHTYYVIVQSENLLRIRKEVFTRYLKQGGDKNCWDPEFFFPHITIGYTHKDIHYPDVKKSIETLDPRVEWIVN